MVILPVPEIKQKEKLITVAQFLDGDAAKWHNDLLYNKGVEWRKAAIKQFVPCEAKPITQLCSNKLSSYTIFGDLITAFWRLVKHALDEQNEDLNVNEAEAATICFNKFYGIPFLQDVLPAVYACFLRQEGPNNLEDTYNCILTQYQDCVEDEPDELEREKLEWNPFAKKKVTKDVRNESSAIMNEIAVLKSFLVQHTLPPPHLLQLPAVWPHCH
ncbi:hypothetical protein DSO57_1007886 [Entomophthora muscae]|uniref:Uncharacterized protein n=1 Tax=Entomophthora muscae TaxID=34485 RepID=A0ACC2SJZ7_9FUNG|nr:hypothetical protein DSO57_1007886 [Entomophthora muscae]